MDLDLYKEKLAAIKNNIEQVIVGKSEIIDKILTALIAEGHVLLEDVPGTGKTVMAKTLAKSIDAEFSRIQFTPDLLPSDITGLNYYNQKEGAFVFRKGPVFCNILLADEINRATPRTQSSLLECMEEKQITVDGETRILKQPFFVIATQNPVETAGTFPLPEAQLDRFLMQISMGLPQREEEMQIVNRFIRNNPLAEIKPVIKKADLLDLQKAYKEIYIHPVLLDYLVRIVEESRTLKSVALGVSPRGTLAFVRAVQAYALIQGREYVIPEDIQILAVPVLAHRIILQGGMSGGSKAVIKQILSAVSVPTEEWKR
ncbi:MAG: MoxR family ATPase [Lachnospiraceae bacterium]|nr:MoxR family ATPase [Lachnospiraceae bacterium]